MDVQRRLAAQILKCGENRIKFDNDSLADIKEAITKQDVRSLINKGIIIQRNLHNTSKFWARKRKQQKVKGRQKGYGSRKGNKTARQPTKRVWINKIRLQRRFIKELRAQKSISTTDYHELYAKSKGGFFRSKRHLRLYTQERGIVKK